MSFQEAYRKFEAKLRQLTRPAPSMGEFNTANNAYHKLLSNYNKLLAIGETEEALRESGTDFVVGRAQYGKNPRGQIMGDTGGMLKLLFHRETLEILGVHCFGMNATEIIHIGQAIMSQPGGGNSIRYFTETTFNYPTMAEAYRVAALNGFNRLF